MDLKLHFLPKATRSLFVELSKNTDIEITNATLMGGTALTLLIGHRLSEDLDFFFFQEKLPVELNKLIASLKNSHSVHSTLTSSQISQARINGYNIEDYIREYLIDNVKISFSVMAKGGESRANYFRTAEKNNYQGAFDILSLDSLFKSKAVTLNDRVKSRDLFDLMVLVRDHGYTIADIVESIMIVDDKDEQQANAVIEVLLGIVPLDDNDPGFNSINLDVSMSDIYNFFRQEVDKYEQSIAKTEIEGARNRRMKNKSLSW